MPRDICLPSWIYYGYKGPLLEYKKTAYVKNIIFFYKMKKIAELIYSVP